MLVAKLAVDRVGIVLMPALGADVITGLARGKFGQALIAPGEVRIVIMAAL